MKKNMKRIKENIKQWCALVVLFLMISGLNSCIHEDIETPLQTAGNYLTIKLRLPGEPYSYTLTDPDENDIRELDVLVFREGGDGKEYYMSSSAVSPGAITTDGSDPSGRTKSCTVEVPVNGSFRQRLVFVANAHAAVADAVAASLKETVLAGIVFKMDGNWPAENSATFTPFPMWGESSLTALTEESNSIDRVYMMRMVARVDMNVHTDLQSDFKLHEVYLYNRYEAGRAVPAPGVLTGSGANLRVNASSVPSGTVPVTEPKNDQFYTTDNNNLTSVTHSIYLMENTPTDVPLKATCFVVGGTYKNGAMRYWRVDLPKQGNTNLSGGFRTFLRNNYYEVVIKAIEGQGHDTPDDAFYKSWTQVDVEVTEWNLADVVFEDQKHFALKASPAVHNYLRAGTAGKQGSFSVWTDYWKSDTNQGWTGELHFADGDDGKWLVLSSTNFSGVKGETKNYRFTVAENTTGEDRHAYLKITAGNLIKYVDIYQTNQVIVDSNTDGYDWVQSDQSETPLDGPYRLGVSQTVVNIDKTAFTTVDFKITTDWKGGYTTRINGGAGVDWITVNSGSQSSGPVVGQDFNFSVSDNPLAVSRSAIIDVIAGNLVKKVKVVQLDYMRGDIYVSMDWTESDYSPGDFDGPYRLGVGRTRFDLPKNAASDIELPIAAQHPSGYKAEVVQGGGWITLAANASSPNTWPTPVKMTFSVAENLENNNRVGEICITSGGLKKYITVSQSVWANIDTGGDVGGWEDIPGEEPLHGAYTLAVGQQSVLCSGDAHAHSTTVTASASSEGVQWKAVANDSWITILTPSGNADGTAQMLSFEAAANPGTITREGSITVSVNHLGNRMEKVIHTRQLGQSIQSVRSETNPLGYVTNQLTRHSFTLYSRLNWALRVKDDPSGVLRTLYTTGGKANEAGEAVYFALKTFSAVSPPTGTAPYTVTLEISSPKGEFLPVEVEIMAVLP